MCWLVLALLDAFDMDVLRLTVADEALYDVVLNE